jgi:hypothetical protein
MTTQTALEILNNWDVGYKRYVYNKTDLGKVFDEQGILLSKTLERLVKANILIHAARDAYVYNYSRQKGAYTLEHIAQSLRRNDYNYISYEYALSEFGVISQIPLDWITVATTGRKGVFATPFGTVEFTHTNRSPEEILANVVERPEANRLPIAKVEYAWLNLKDTHRSQNLVPDDWREEYYDQED